MIVTIVRGGLGNQFFQISAAMYLSKQTGHSVRIDDRFLQIDGDKRRSILPRFRFGFRPSGWFLHVITRIARRLYYRYSHWRFLVRNPLLNFVADPEDGTSDTLSAIGHAAVTIIDGYWQVHKFSDPLIPVLRRAIVPRHVAGDPTRILIKELASRRTAALHIRRGDYVHDDKTRSFHGLCGPDYYERAINFLDERTQVDAIYVFSDEIHWVIKNLPLDSRAVYVNEDGRLSDVEEFYIMSRCHHFVIANSSFSWWAAKLAAGPNKIVIAPKQWLAVPTKFDQGLIPTDWYRL